MTSESVAGWQGRYAEALRLLGPNAGADPLACADALWLARVLPGPRERAGTLSSMQQLAPHRPREAEPKGRSHAEPPDHTPATVTPIQPGAVPTMSLFTPQPGAAGETQLKARRVPVPVADALPGRSAIERALKPFLRRRPSAVHCAIDADATAEASANASAELFAAGASGHAIVPVLRPVAERWFDVALVAERDEAMLAFEDTLIELRNLMARHGAFGQVRLWRFAVQGDAVVVQSPAGLPSAPRGLLQSHRHQLILLLTHGASPHWEQPTLRDFVRDLAQRSVVSIVQMLPSTSWSFTALGEAGERVRSPERGVPNRLLERLDVWRGMYVSNSDAAAIPVLSMDQRGIADWARWVMTARRLDHAAVTLNGARTVALEAIAEATQAGLAGAESAAREQVVAFRNVASEQAFALLRLLAASWITLPVMRLLANALPGPRSATPLAEVLLSGLLVRTSPTGVPPHEMVFDFVPGVREWLHGSLSSDEQRQASAAMATSRENIRRFVEEKTGVRLASFDALLLDTAGDDLLPASARSFVEVSRRLRSLRGLSADDTPAPTQPARAAVVGALYDFPPPVRDLIPRPQLHANILQRVLRLPIASTEQLWALPGSGALVLMSQVLSHPAVRQRFSGGIWFGSEPPPRLNDPSAPRLHLCWRTGSGRKQPGDTRINLVWVPGTAEPDVGYIPRADAAAYLATLGVSQAQAKRLQPLHCGMPLLLQLVGVGTTFGITHWPRVAAEASRDERFGACTRELLATLDPAQANGLIRMAVRRPGYPAATPLPGAELAPRLGWLCPGAPGMSDTLSPPVARRLETIYREEAAAAHAAVPNELREVLTRQGAADYARRHLLEHAQAAGGIEEVRRTLFDRQWLAVLLGGGVPQLLAQLRPLARRDKPIAAFTARLAELAALVNTPEGLLQPPVLDGARAALAPAADWRGRMRIDIAHRANLTGTGVCVALVTTGVDAGHPELQHLRIDGDTTDENGHGTAVASVIAGRFIGIAPGVRLWSLRALDAQGRGTNESLVHALAAIAAAPESERPDIVCLPFGGSEVHVGGMREALLHLHELGIVLIAAAGNEGLRTRRLEFPASMPQVVAVGSLTADGAPAEFSARTEEGRPELWAPGVDIVVALPAAQHAARPVPKGRRAKNADATFTSYRPISGTSVSCAAVAGLAALCAESTGLRGAALRDLLLRTAAGGRARFVAGPSAQVKAAHFAARGAPDASDRIIAEQLHTYATRTNRYFDPPEEIPGRALEGYDFADLVLQLREDEVLLGLYRNQMGALVATHVHGRERMDEMERVHGPAQRYYAVERAKANEGMRNAIPAPRARTKLA